MFYLDIFNKTVFNYTFLNNYVHSHGNYIRTYITLACNYRDYSMAKKTPFGVVNGNQRDEAQL